MIIAKIINDDEKITLGDLTDKIKKDSLIEECGAIFTFEGIVRGKDDSKITDKIILSSHDSVKTEKALEVILRNIKKTHGIKSIAVVHYLGHFEPGDSMFMAAVAGAHRHETRAALEETIERVKYELDFKKEEEGSAGRNIIMSGG